MLIPLRLHLQQTQLVVLRLCAIVRLARQTRVVLLRPLWVAPPNEAVVSGIVEDQGERQARRVAAQLPEVIDGLGKGGQLILRARITCERVALLQMICYLANQPLNRREGRALCALLHLEVDLRDPHSRAVRFEDISVEVLWIGDAQSPPPGLIADRTGGLDLVVAHAAVGAVEGHDETLAETGDIDGAHVLPPLCATVVAVHLKEQGLITTDVAGLFLLPPLIDVVLNALGEVPVGRAKMIGQISTVFGRGRGRRGSRVCVVGLWHVVAHFLQLLSGAFVERLGQSCVGRADGFDERVAGRIVKHDSEGQLLACGHGFECVDDALDLARRVEVDVLSDRLILLQIGGGLCDHAFGGRRDASLCGGRDLKLILKDFEGGVLRFDDLPVQILRSLHFELDPAALVLQGRSRLNLVVVEATVRT
mmetsp:Transcript_34826/g.100258  ORF Transcript_34826/g.100258 Transcript_34826/m.100258 type:complete len:422 (-) Transcript_34826:1007-2272(-)